MGDDVVSDEEAALKRLAELVGDGAELNPDLAHDAAVVKLIRVRRRVGEGSIDDPRRVVTTYHSLEGGVVYEEDPRRADDPRIELLQTALRESLRGWKKALADTTTAAQDEAHLDIFKRIAKLEKLTDPEWRPA